jgi:hypothetical protein
MMKLDDDETWEILSQLPTPNSQLHLILVGESISLSGTISHFNFQVGLPEKYHYICLSKKWGPGRALKKKKKKTFF